MVQHSVPSHHPRILGSLPGPSRRITVEPIRVPATPPSAPSTKPQREPARRQPEPKREPARAR
jgi:hypothetical protein